MSASGAAVTLIGVIAVVLRAAGLRFCPARACFAGSRRSGEIEFFPLHLGDAVKILWNPNGFCRMKMIHWSHSLSGHVVP